MNTLFAPLFLFFCLLFTQAAAQHNNDGWLLWTGQNQFSYEQVPQNIITKMENLQSRQNLQVHCANISSTGAWVFAYHSGGATPAMQSYNISWDGIFSECRTELQELCAQKQNIRQIVFSPNYSWQDQRYLILHGEADCVWRGLSPDLEKQLLAIHARQQGIRSVALSPDKGWVVFSTDNKVYYKGISKELAFKLEELQAANHQLNFIEFTPFGGWLVLYDKNDAAWDSIPSGMQAELQRLKAQDKQIKGCSFYMYQGKL